MMGRIEQVTGMELQEFSSFEGDQKNRQGEVEKKTEELAYL